MSAPVAIPVASAAGQTPAGSPWAQTAQPVAGFEALLAALFPTGTAVQPGQVKLGQAATEPKTDEPKTDGAETVGIDNSALQAQLASLLAVQPVQVQPTQATPTTDATDGLKAATPAPVIVAAKSDPTSPTPTVQAAIPAAPEITASPAAPAQSPAVSDAQPAPASPASDQPLIQPAAEPKAPPPPVLAAALPLAEAPIEPPALPAAPPPIAATAAASAEAKPAAKSDRLESPAPGRAAAAAPAAPAIPTETAAAAQPAQASADGGDDQPPPEQRDTASSEQGAPDTLAAPTAGPASAAHMIEAQAAAVAARGSPETVAKLAAQIVKKLEGRSSRFDIALDPVGLGKVDVKVEINAQGQMTAALNFDTAAAAAELRGRAGELRAALEQAGFDLNNANLSFSFSGQGDSSGQTFAQRDGQRGAGRQFQAFADDQPVAAGAPSPSLLDRRTSGVDVRI